MSDMHFINLSDPPTRLQWRHRGQHLPSHEQFFFLPCSCVRELDAEIEGTATQLASSMANQGQRIGIVTSSMPIRDGGALAEDVLHFLD